MAEQNSTLHNRKEVTSLKARHFHNCVHPQNYSKPLCIAAPLAKAATTKKKKYSTQEMTVGPTV
jgi:hypothetical protein